jgi:hypothetical protein
MTNALIFKPRFHVTVKTGAMGSDDARAILFMGNRAAVAMRAAFSASPFGKFVEENRISYYMEQPYDVRLETVFDDGEPGQMAVITGAVAFRCSEENDMLLRLRADGNTVKTIQG